MESPNSKIIIGCDIGGVLKTLPDRILIPGAIDGVKSLSKTFKVVLISKTKKPEDPRKIIFLRENGIDFIEAYYCKTYEGKIDLALQTKINYMIDDRMEVLSILPKEIIKLWFCDDPVKIEEWAGREEFKMVTIVKNWEAVIEYFSKITP